MKVFSFICASSRLALTSSILSGRSRASSLARNSITASELLRSPDGEIKVYRIRQVVPSGQKFVDFVFQGTKNKTDSAIRPKSGCPIHLQGIRENTGSAIRPKSGCPIHLQGIQENTGSAIRPKSGFPFHLQGIQENTGSAIRPKSGCPIHLQSCDLSRP